MWRYSQQDLISDKVKQARKKAATTEPLGLVISYLGLVPPFLSWQLTSTCCSVQAFFTQSHRAVTECCKAEWKWKRISAKYYNGFTTVFHIPYFPLSISGSTIPLSLWFPNATISVAGQKTLMSNIVSFLSVSACSLFLSFEFLSAWTGRWMEGKGVSGWWVSPRQAHPSRLV